jgi:hypothetical protein
MKIVLTTHSDDKLKTRKKQQPNINTHTDTKNIPIVNWDNVINDTYSVGILGGK